MLLEVSAPPKSPNTSALGTRMQNPDASSPRLILRRTCRRLALGDGGGGGVGRRGEKRSGERKTRRREANGANDDVTADVIT
ncbi:hypothetical protein ALC62_02737 [Cyphomyrmex costatus]|uniref:Uncharacterized protein n=1 Tax=Cyphomyrmex costatus TaxID=456900 RepID=A0A195D1X2_9HYME|nr:hypothetical protein ALC62_02737 [Cyphomyrmex costatus]